MAAEPLRRTVGERGVSASRSASTPNSNRDGLGRGGLAGVQRARVLAGAVQVVGERGASNVAVAEIVACAGVSRRTFYELFSDRDECLLAAFEDALEVAAARVLPTVSEQVGWLARLRAGVRAVTRFLDEEPQLGRFLVCGSLSGERGLSEWRGRVVAQLVAFVDEGRKEGQDKQVPSMQAEGSVGGVLAILANLYASEEPTCFTELCSSFVAMIAMPYLGAAVARRELERSAPPSPVSVSSRSQFSPVLPFKAVGMRLTYRTMRVLVAIAECPGASNRRIGDLAGISDQGQISKLLRRLLRAGFVSNDWIAVGQGAPNVWRLTEDGARLADSFSAYSDTAPGAEEVTVEEATSAGRGSRRPSGSVRQGRSHNPRREK